jgi:hypothetical protein
MREQQPKSGSDEDLAQVMKGRGPCTYLLLSLLGLILVYPYLRDSVISRILLGVFYSMVLLCGAYAIRQNGRALFLRYGLAALGVALQWIALLTKSTATRQFSAIVYAMFLVITIAEVLRYILRREPLTADKLHGAMAGYIMLAFLWAFIYALTESLRPGSFAPANLDLGGADAFFHFLYFSFTTLTTTGFGDIVPVSHQARSFVIIEQFTGVFFVGVLIARLAGLYPAKQ